MREKRCPSLRSGTIPYGFLALLGMTDDNGGDECQWGLRH